MLQRCSFSLLILTCIDHLPTIVSITHPSTGVDKVFHIICNVETADRHELEVVEEVQRFKFLGENDRIRRRRAQIQCNQFADIFTDLHSSTSDNEILSRDELLHFDVLYDVWKNDQQFRSIAGRHVDDLFIRHNVVLDLKNRAYRRKITAQHSNGNETYLCIAVTPHSSKRAKRLMYLIFSFDRGDLRGVFGFDEHCPRSKWWRFNSLDHGLMLYLKTEKLDISQKQEEALKLLSELYRGQIVSTRVFLNTDGQRAPRDWQLERFEH